MHPRNFVTWLPIPKLFSFVTIIMPLSSVQVQNKILKIRSKVLKLNPAQDDFRLKMLKLRNDLLHVNKAKKPKAKK